MLGLAGFGFAAPWVLLGFVAVPALWWLLRVTPPAPRLVRFPAIRLLVGIEPPEETPARTPLWLILLRMALAALLILALAHPVVDPGKVLAGTGPLLLVVDDGWAAAPGWPARQRLAGELIDRAERDGRKVALLTTAPATAQATPGLLTPAAARGAVAALRPRPWPTDRAAAARRLDGFAPRRASVYWLSDGLEDKGTAALAARLAALGPTHVALPAPDRLARLLVPGPADAPDLTVTLRRAAPGDAMPAQLHALGPDGRLLGQAPAQIPAGRVSIKVPLKLPIELRNRVARIEIAGEPGAGATLLLDGSSQRRLVGIVSDRPEGSIQPLLSDTYYIERALQPFAELRRGTAAALSAGGVGMLVLPDGDPGPTETRAALGRWIEGGGVLLRFAGPALAGSTDDALLPVTLRRGDRTIGGTMSWEKPAHLAAFPSGSPFAGLAVPADVTVDRQVLAEPSVDLEARTWARLTDGTPLVTAERRGKGWLVLVHTSANGEWSNLALSGLFVEMLRRVAELGQGAAAAAEATLAPWQTMDGFGRLAPAPPAVQPIAAGALDKTAIGPTHPPGLYGTAAAHRALNLAPGIGRLAALGELPPAIIRQGYRAAPELDLRPGLLGTALALALIDLLLGYWLRGLLRWPGGRGLGAAVLLLGLALGEVLPAQAQTPPAGSDAFDIAATSQLHLAYVHTGDDQVDRESRSGLTGLDAVLSRRTAVETGDPMEVDVEHDELIFFPLIYWPITASQPPLSAQAAERVNRYLATGGTILFDTQDQGTAPPGGFGATATAARLNTLLAGVTIPPLTQVPADHVLTKSFYLMQDFPGRWLGGTLWVEPAEDRVNDGVSTVILGSNDWAGAWAVDAQGFPLNPVVPGGEAQREMAYRFGVNLVMYALTGNYKADQVHVPAILERLGQ